MWDEVARMRGQVQDTLLRRWMEDQLAPPVPGQWMVDEVRPVLRGVTNRSRCVVEWRPQISKHSVRRLSARWTDDLRKIAGGGWMRIVENWDAWGELG
ncbi:unnamed protein product [Euphydryas editha]|uniref:Uncharacterized protein n=1 Tax=Euphydryas editha TaxID=104508 RepID=A0AAU9UWT4_EUPED|nr:unnamed protein product [Euphydryas editha]